MAPLWMVIVVAFSLYSFPRVWISIPKTPCCVCRRPFQLPGGAIICRYSCRNLFPPKLYIHKDIAFGNIFPVFAFLCHSLLFPPLSMSLSFSYFPVFFPVSGFFSSTGESPVATIPVGCDNHRSAIFLLRLPLSVGGKVGSCSPRSLLPLSSIIYPSID